VPRVTDIPPSTPPGLRAIFLPAGRFVFVERNCTSECDLMITDTYVATSDLRTSLTGTPTRARGVIQEKLHYLVRAARTDRSLLRTDVQG